MGRCVGGEATHTRQALTQASYLCPPIALHCVQYRGEIDSQIDDIYDAFQGYLPDKHTSLNGGTHMMQTDEYPSTMPSLCVRVSVFLVTGGCWSASRAARSNSTHSTHRNSTT